MIAAGQSIGNYRILNKIGTGGMGAVYLAEHPLIGKRVALKVIHRELAGNRDVVSRFFQEARAVNKIGNEHIVEIHDFGVTPDGDHFFIMEYLEGQTVASVLSREAKIEILRSLHIGAQIANALASAHTAGIVHRDIKPDNIMLLSRLGDADFVKVLDFGLAKVFSAHGAAVKTAAGVLLGTPQYMSPEACESKGDIDHRTDVYALGVLLFQMMTGVLPFDGESMGEVLVKQVTALPPAPRGINPAIPPSVEQILLRCLAKRAEARFPTMIDVREALLDPEAYLRSAPPIAQARAVRGDGLGEAGTTMTTALYPVPTGAAAAQPAPQHHAQPAPAQPMPAHQQPTRLAIAQPVVAPHQQHTQLATEADQAPPHAHNTRLAGPPQVPPHLQHTRLATAGPPAGRAASAATAEPGERTLRVSTAMPALAPPVEPQMNTMRIATPLGYSSRPPPRRIWPWVFGAAAVLGVVVGVLATTCGSSPGPSGPGDSSTASAGDSLPLGAPAGGQTDGSAKASKLAASPDGAGNAAAPAGAGATPAAATRAAMRAQGQGPAATDTAKPVGAPGRVRRVRLSINSVPSNALVTGPRGQLLGKTPLTTEWPVSDQPITFELALAGYKKKLKQAVINSNTALHLELERAPAVRRPGNPRGTGSARPGSDNDLMAPE